MHRKTVEGRKLVPPFATPALTNRETFGGTNRKTLTRSTSFTSVSSSMLRTPSDENDGIIPNEKEVEMYEEEYALYLLRMLQLKTIRDEDREEEAKKCLVSLKKEYEDLLMENVSLYEEVRNMLVYSAGIERLDAGLRKGNEVLRILREANFDRVMNTVALALESEVNRLGLVDLKRSDLEKAFAENVLGFESDLYQLLKRMEKHGEEQEALLPEIVQEIKAIEALHTENEELKNRCNALANQKRRTEISSGSEKYFRMAVEECRDLLEKLPERRVSSHSCDDASLPQRTSELGAPASSSTPTVTN